MAGEFLYFLHRHFKVAAGLAVISGLITAAIWIGHVVNALGSGA